MKYSITYCFLILLVIFLPACDVGRKKVNKRVTLWRSDKIPYGTYYAYQQLQYMFPDATIEVKKDAPRFYSFLSDFSEDSSYHARHVYLIISPAVQPNRRELEAMLQHAQQGNHVFISSLNIGQNILDTFKLETAYYSGYFNQSDSLHVKVTDPTIQRSEDYKYPGSSLDNYFVSFDSTMTHILGRDGEGQPNFVKFSYDGGGAVYLHLAPLALTNYFLLHGRNKTYYDKVFSYLPATASVVQWDDYFRNVKRKEFSALQVILQSPELRWGFWLTLALFGLIYLFDSKRRQRPIPYVRPLKNASLDFVKTIGRLYYQRRDNKNLGLKMATHFLDGIRSRFNLSISEMDGEFSRRLAEKSGVDQADIQDIVYIIKTLPDQVTVSDEFLMEFNAKLEKFNKQTA